MLDNKHQTMTISTMNQAWRSSRGAISRSGLQRTTLYHRLPRIFKTSYPVRNAQTNASDETFPLPEQKRGGVPENIWNKTNRSLHLKPNHPLCLLRETIEAHLQHSYSDSQFNINTTLSPIVSVKDCFDDLLVPQDHVSRSKADTYYVDGQTLLRTHMTAHDTALIRSGVRSALSTGDVYRRDTIDRTHYPIFHQMDGFKLYGTKEKSTKEIEIELKHILQNLAHVLFGEDTESRWVDTYFPFTEPSFELEILWQNNEWLEVLGCGILHADVLRNAGQDPNEVHGWAFGLGLERLAMVLFGIPDIRLFWSDDQRFISQFEQGKLQTTYKPFSIYPSIEKHVSFWVEDKDAFHENDFCQVARDVGGDLIEQTSIIDTFEKNGKKSVCFNVVFRSLHRTLTHTEVNEMYHRLRDEVAQKLPVTVR